MAAASHEQEAQFYPLWCEHDSPVQLIGNSGSTCVLREGRLIGLIFPDPQYLNN
jgi:hypothetical protein